MIIWGLILGRSHPNAPTVRKHHQCKVLKFIWGHILGRSHTNAPIVGKLFQLKGIFKGTWGLIVKTSHINASSVRIWYFFNERVSPRAFVYSYRGAANHTNAYSCRKWLCAGILIKYADKIMPPILFYDRYVYGELNVRIIFIA